MTTERFTLDQFKDALPPQAEYKGLVYGEHVFFIQLGKARLEIRSSIGLDGIARDSGDDSIRFVLVDDRGVLGKSADTYTQRTPGWQARLGPKIDYMISLRQQALDCKVCGSPLHISKSKKGETVAWCREFSHKQWVVLNIDKPPRPLDTFAWPGNSKPALSPPDTKPKPASLLDIAAKRETSAIQPAPASTASEWAEVINGNDKPLPPMIALSTRIDLSFLNDDQRRIVLNGGKGILALDSVPGSGKTTTLKYLVAYMISELKIHPSRIGCFTFSKKGASEMRTRIAKLVWPGISDQELKFFDDPGAREDGIDENGFNQEWVEADPIRTFLVKWVCTIHALCYRLLREWYGPNNKMHVLAGDPRKSMDADQIIKDALLEFKWKESPRSVRAYIGSAIRALIPTYKAADWFHSAIEEMGGPTYRAGNLAEIYDRYLKFMLKNNLIDYDMMQANVVKLIKSEPLFVDKIQDMFDYILVDESQDTDGTQSMIFFTMADLHRNLSYIGDVDQSLYVWRGAVPEIMTSKYDAYWKNVARFQLPINNRSTRSIIKTCSTFITKNYPPEKAKYLKAYGYREDALEGIPMQAAYFDDFDDLCAGIVERLRESDDPGNWYILSRTRAECAAIHTALVEAGIKSINKSGGMVFGADHIRKVIAYARLAIDYEGSRDNVEILSEVANVASKDFISSVTRRRHEDGCAYADKPWGQCNCPIIVKEGRDHNHTRWYGKKSIEEARNWDGVYMQTLETRYDRTEGGHVSTMRAKGALDLYEFVNACQKFAGNAHDCIRYIIDNSVLPWLMVEKGISYDDPSESSEMEDFALFSSMITEGMTVEDFLKEIDRLTNKGKGADENESVVLGTVHWAKGAERPKVIVNMSRMPVVPPPVQEDQLVVSRPATIAEERCVAYVAATRAKEELVVYASRKWLGKPLPRSIFYDEITSAAGMLPAVPNQNQEEDDE